MKLDGVRVLDLSPLLPRPCLTTVMADRRAEVVKLEPPGGEPVRRTGLRAGGGSVRFRNTHRDRKSVVRNLNKEGNRTALRDLVQTCDVMLKTFGRGVSDRLGIGAAAMTALNPRLIRCSISAFGQHGPLRDRPVHGPAVEAPSWLPNAIGAVFAEARPRRAREEQPSGGGACHHIRATKDGRRVVQGGSEHEPDIGLPIRFRGEPGRLDPRLPRLGEHAAPVLAEARRRRAPHG